MAASREGALVSFGVVPDSHHTGYGYLRSGSELAEGVHQLEEFVEKPDLETARSYLDQGSYLWNSGMFLFSARSFLDELERLQPDMLDSCRLALADAGRELAFVRHGEEAIADCLAAFIAYVVSMYIRITSD